jgi:hypothetical protein
MLLRVLKVVPLLAVLVFLADSALGQAAGSPRYKFQPGGSLVYRVEIRADKGDEVEILSGFPEFRVQSLEAGQAKVLLSNPQLSERTERKPGARGIAPLRFPSIRVPRTPFEFQGHEVVLNERGQVASERGQSQVSFMLGNLSSLIFESFPEDAQDNWSFTERQTISISQRSRFPRPRGGDAEVERLNAEETTKYIVKESTAEQVQIQRDLTLKSIEKTADGPRLEQTLSGIYIFNRKTGLPQSITYDGHVIAREGNTTTRIPLTVRINHLTPAELQKVREEQVRLAAEAKTRADQQAAERKRPLAADERAELLAGLQSGEKSRVRQALQKLKDKEPPQPDKELAQEISLQLASGDLFLRQGAAEALEKWGTAAEAPLLIAALDDKHLFVTHAALRALGRLQDPAAVPAIAAKLKEPGTRNQAVQALKASGAAAEKDVLTLLAHDDWGVRMEACNILAEIGSGASLAPLKTAADGDANGLVKVRAKAAVEAVEKRAKP